MARPLQIPGGETRVEGARRIHAHQGEAILDNDRNFAAYALLLLAGIVTVVISVVLANGRPFPGAFAFAEPVILGLTVRFAYKWIGGFDRADWSIASDRVREPAGEMLPGGTADAMG